MNRLKSLLDSQYCIVPFKALTLPYQLALVQYFAAECNSWDILFEDCPEPDFIAAMPQYIERYGNTRWGVALLDTQRIQDAICQDPEIKESYPDWATYHEAYCHPKDPDPIPDTDKWPVILSKRDDETILDGWHRMHHYSMLKCPRIPAVFDPSGL